MAIRVGDEVIFAPHHIAHGQRGVVEAILYGQGGVTFYRIRPLQALATMHARCYQLTAQDFYRVDAPPNEKG